MIDKINKYRNASERTRLIIGIEEYIRLTNGQCEEKGKNNALCRLKWQKNGCISAKKELDVLLCDVVAVLCVAIGAVILIKKVKKAFIN